MELITMFWLLIWNILSTSSKIDKAGRKAEYAETVSMFVIQLKAYQKHKINCHENEATTIALTTIKKKLHQFKSTKATWFVLLVVYFDTRLLLVFIHTCASAPSAGGQMKLKKHIPSGNAFFNFVHGNDNILPYRTKREKNCLRDFIGELEKTAKKIYNRQQNYRFFRNILQYQMNLTMTAGFALFLSKKTDKKFWTIFKAVVCS